MSRQHRMAGLDDPPCVDLEVCSGARSAERGSTTAVSKHGRVRMGFS
jgi:hypothetical protein